MRAIADASSLLVMMKHLGAAELLSKLKGIATLDLAAYEVGNGFWKWVSLTRAISQEEAKELLRALKKVLLMPDFTVMSWRDLDVLATLDLAVENNVTFYDASYIMASVVFKKPLITEDEKLKQVAAGHTQVLSWEEV